MDMPLVHDLKDWMNVHGIKLTDLEQKVGLILKGRKQASGQGKG